MSNNDPLAFSGGTDEGDPKPLSGPNDLTRKIAPVPSEEVTPPTETLGTEEMGPASDVYVILPEGEEANVPVVETEVVEEEENLAPSSNTEVLEADEGEGVEQAGTFAAEVPPGAPENLEDLATELDDELLVEAGESGGRVLPRIKARASESGSFLKGEEDLLSVGRSSRPKALLSTAALLVVGLAAFLSFPQWKSYVGLGEHSSLVVSTKGHPPAGVTPSGASGQATKPPEDGSTAPGSGQTVATAKTTELDASKEAFREKFLLALELGYVGEVGNE
jgi:hypothetical protein